MRNLNDDATFPIPCPNCSKEFEKAVGEIRANPQFACPHCGLSMDGANFKAAIERGDQIVEDLKRKIGRMGK